MAPTRNRGGTGSEAGRRGTLVVRPGLEIGEREIEERFIRASGPGGQNVNKVATAVQIQFDAGHSPSLPEAVRERLLRLAGRRLSSDGVVTIVARRFRTQEENRADGRRRLMDLLRLAAEPPKPRHPTRPTAGSRARRLEEKRHRAETKSSRRPPVGSDLAS